MTEDGKSRKIIHVASRKSVLAMAQTNEVIEMLQVCSTFLGPST